MKPMMWGLYDECDWGTFTPLGVVWFENTSLLEWPISLNNHLFILGLRSGLSLLETSIFIVAGFQRTSLERKHALSLPVCPRAGKSVGIISFQTLSRGSKDELPSWIMFDTRTPELSAPAQFPVKKMPSYTAFRKLTNQGMRNEE
jgi:hypothetical protein